MATKTYKVTTGQSTVEFVEADQVELDPGTNRVTFYLDGDPVASYVGYTSFSVHDPALVQESTEQTP